MNLPKHYAKSLRSNLRVQAVWPPIQAIVPGDYGEYEGGIFTPRGNITTDFGVPSALESGGHLAEKFQYHSEHGRSGGLAVSGGSAGTEAGIEVSLANTNAFFLSVSSCELVRLQSKRAVAELLREVPDWRFLKYYVVWELFRGRDLVFFGSEQGGGGVTVRGSTRDLGAFAAAGTVGLSLQFATRGAVDLQFRGAPDEPASFAVNVFRVRRAGDLVAMSFGLGDPLVDITDHDEEL